MSALERIGTLLLILLFIATIACWLMNPVKRNRIDGRPIGHRININTADVATLSLLSGISATIGEYIIEHRQTQGPIRSPQDLDRIRFIGPVTLKKIAPYITFDETNPPKPDGESASLRGQ